MCGPLGGQRRKIPSLQMEYNWNRHWVRLEKKSCLFIMLFHPRKSTFQWNRLLCGGFLGWSTGILMLFSPPNGLLFDLIDWNESISNAHRLKMFQTRCGFSKYNCVVWGFKWKETKRKIREREKMKENAFQMVRQVIYRNSCGLIVIYWVSGSKGREKRIEIFHH